MAASELPSPGEVVLGWSLAEHNCAAAGEMRVCSVCAALEAEVGLVYCAVAAAAAQRSGATPMVPAAEKRCAVHAAMHAAVEDSYRPLVVRCWCSRQGAARPASEHGAKRLQCAERVDGHVQIWLQKQLQGRVAQRLESHVLGGDGRRRCV